MLRVDDDASARTKIRSFISSARPDAVLTGSDKIAAIVYGTAAELNLSIGRDLAVVGFDGSVGAGLLHPPLTSVVIPVDEIAQRVVGRALRQIENDPEPSRARLSRPGCAKEKALRFTGDGRAAPGALPAPAHPSVTQRLLS